MRKSYLSVCSLSKVYSKNNRDPLYFGTHSSSSHKFNFANVQSRTSYYGITLCDSAHAHNATCDTSILTVILLWSAFEPETLNRTRVSDKHERAVVRVTPSVLLLFSEAVFLWWFQSHMKAPTSRRPMLKGTVLSRLRKSTIMNEQRSSRLVSKKKKKRLFPMTCSSSVLFDWRLFAESFFLRVERTKTRHILYKSIISCFQT